MMIEKDKFHDMGEWVEVTFAIEVRLLDTYNLKSFVEVAGVF